MFADRERNAGEHNRQSGTAHHLFAEEELRICHAGGFWKHPGDERPQSFGNREGTDFEDQKHLQESRVGEQMISAFAG